ncbi:MAG: endonuclease V [bacterium]
MGELIKKLVEIQKNIASGVEISNQSYPLEFFQTVVGIDLSFHKNNIIVCFTVYELTSRTIHFFYKLDKSKFPYVPTFLAFRELPAINKLYKKLYSEFPTNTLFFIDGHGISHPRRAGIATHFGVKNNRYSIGVAKRLLYGKIQDPSFANNDQILQSYVIDDNQYPIAIALKTLLLNRKKVMGTKILYISVGNKLNLENSKNLFLELYQKHKIIPTELSHDYLQNLKKNML